MSNKLNYALISDSIENNLKEGKFYDEMEKRYAEHCLNYLKASKLFDVKLDYNAYIVETVLLLDEEKSSVLLKKRADIHVWAPPEKEVVDNLLSAQTIKAPEELNIFNITARLVPDEKTKDFSEDMQQDDMVYFVTYLYKYKKLSHELNDVSLRWFDLKGIDNLYEEDFYFDSPIKRIIEKIKKL